MSNTSPAPQKRLIGLTIFGWLLISSSIVHMTTLIFGYQWYHDNYAYWPEWLFNTRYGFSWLQRILGISAGIGLLRGNDFCRKIAIAIGVFTISTLYWKHHYPAFLRHCQSLDEQFAGVFQYIGYPGFSFVRFCLPALIVHCLLDIIFCGSLWYYLTRPSVKNYFRKSHGSSS